MKNLRGMRVIKEQEGQEKQWRERGEESLDLEVYLFKMLPPSSFPEARFLEHKPYVGHLALGLHDE